MTTAKSIIKQAMRKIGVLGAGETLQAEDAQNGLQALNNLLGSLTVEGGVIHVNSKETFPCDGSVSYTVGTGGDFDTTPPIKISGAFTSQGTTDYPMLQINENDYANITDKTTGAIPEVFYYDNNRPLATLYLHPAPSSAYTLTLYSKKPLEEFTSLTDDIELPKGLEKALVFNLTIDIAPEFEKEVSLSVIQNAKKSLSNFKTFNKVNNYPTSSVDKALVSSGRFNINTGQYN